MPVAAIEALVELLGASHSSTVFETMDLVKAQSEKLRAAVTNPIPLSPSLISPLVPWRFCLLLPPASRSHPRKHPIFGKVATGGTSQCDTGASEPVVECMHAAQRSEARRRESGRDVRMHRLSGRMHQGCSHERVKGGRGKSRTMLAWELRNPGMGGFKGGPLG